jgi:hypothetical protein
MVPSPSGPSVRGVKEELKRLRQGQGLGHPTTVLDLSPLVREALIGGASDRGQASDVVRLVAALRGAIDGLGEHERLYALTDFNLVPEHAYPTLTERQESLATVLKCASKTVRRHADQALETLALIIVTGNPRLLSPTPVQARLAVQARQPGLHGEPWRQQLGGFWRLNGSARVDIVCSEIPVEEQPEFASPTDRNYLRYAKFADLDSLIYGRTRLAQLFPAATIRDFAPSEYYDTDADALIVIGGPPWNAKYREFLPQLPYYFEPHPLGEDDPLVVPQLNNLKMGPCWTERSELLEDLAVFTRLTLAQGTGVFLLGGCLTLGVLGAAKCFLQGDRGARNADYVSELVGEQDFVLITETRRIGGISDMADLTMAKPLLLLARDSGRPSFHVVADNTARCQGIL